MTCTNSSFAGNHINSESPTGTPTLGGGQGAAAPPALVQGLNYFSAKMFMMPPQYESCPLPSVRAGVPGRHNAK